MFEIFNVHPLRPVITIHPTEVCTGFFRTDPKFIFGRGAESYESVFLEFYDDLLVPKNARCPCFFYELKARRRTFFL